MKQEDFFTKHSVKLAFFLVVIGVIVIIVFMCRTPFNDWSGETDPTLFAQYGDFIGGFIGTFFSLAGFFLLYKTLLAQQDTLMNQEKDSLIQKEAIDKERFETTFFNLLSVQQNITDNIKAYFGTMEGLDSERVNIVAGREFFLYARSELSKINYSIFNTKYLGSYDKNNVEYLEHYISELYDPQSSNYTHPLEAEQKEANIIQETSVKYANKFYGITNIHWKNINEKDTPTKIKYVYYFFFRRFHYAIGHYFRNLYHILKFIEKYEINKINNTPNTEEHAVIIEDCSKYAQFIQAQMSSYELTLLYYNALCFPKSLRLILKYNLLENLAKEDLIANKHYDENNIILKSRPQLFDF